MSEFKTANFVTGLQKGDTAIMSVTLKRPEGGELRGLQIASLQVGDVNAMFKLVPRISSPHLTEADLNSLKAEDVAELAEQVSGFFMTSAARAYQTESQTTLMN